MLDFPQPEDAFEQEGQDIVAAGDAAMNDGMDQPPQHSFDNDGIHSDEDSTFVASSQSSSSAKRSISSDEEDSPWNKDKVVGLNTVKRGARMNKTDCLLMTIFAAWPI